MIQSKRLCSLFLVAVMIISAVCNPIRAEAATKTTIETIDALIKAVGCRSQIEAGQTAKGYAAITDLFSNYDTSDKRISQFRYKTQLLKSAQAYSTGRRNVDKNKTLAYLQFFERYGLYDDTEQHEFNKGVDITQAIRDFNKKNGTNKNYTITDISRNTDGLYDYLKTLGPVDVDSNFYSQTVSVSRVSFSTCINNVPGTNEVEDNGVNKYFWVICVNDHFSRDDILYYNKYDHGSDDKGVHYWSNQILSSSTFSSSNYTALLSQAAHGWDDGVVTKASTYTTLGTKVHTCLICGETYEELIPMLPCEGTDLHGSKTYVENAKKPGCGTEGNTGDVRCQYCKKIITKGQVIPASHTFAEEYTVDTPATCTSEGSKSRHCVYCGEHSSAESIPIDANAHHYINPTEIETGIQLTCEYCGQTKIASKCNYNIHENTTVTGIVEACPHREGSSGDLICDDCGQLIEKGKVIEKTTGNYDDDGTLISESTCSVHGQVQYKCVVCKTVTRTEELPLKSHKYGPYVVTTAATCKTPGVKTATCSECGDTITASIDKITEHTWNNGVVKKAATCKNTGIITKTCTVCGETADFDLPVLSTHTWDNGTITKHATCVEQGVATYTCTVCSKKRIEVLGLAPSNHRWDTGKVAKPATCKSKGQVLYTCLDCKSTDLRDSDINPNGHDYISGLCRYCGAKAPDYIEVCKHTASVGVEKVKATCDKDGIMEYKCSSCGKKITEAAIPATGHTYSTSFTVDIPATCKSVGSKSKHCLKCDAKTSVTEIPISNVHTYDSGVITRQPTTTSTGVKTYTCTVCKSTKIESIPKLDNGSGGGGSTPSENPEIKPDEPSDHTHVYLTRVVTKATCKSEGTRSYTCLECGYQKTGVIPKTEHSWNNGVVTTASTCKDTGIKTFTCLVCQATTTESIPKSSKHASLEVVNKKDATCTEAGYTGDSKCKVCNEVVVTGTKIKALGHTYKSDVTKLATETEEGIRTFTCTTCNDTYTESIPKLGTKVECKHTSTEVRSKMDATCAKAGYTGDIYCKDCGIMLTAGHIVSKLSTHKYDEGVVTKQPTETTTGVKTYTCTVCGHKQEELLDKIVPGKFTVTYVLNGGTSNSTINKTEFTADTPTFTLYPANRFGYKFEGWYTDKNCTNKITKIVKGTNRNVTVYARWSKIHVAKVTGLKLTKGKKQFKTTFKKLSGVSGYEIQYSTKSNMRLPKVKTVTKTTSKITSLKGKTKYYVRVRAFIKSNGKKVYGSWSRVKSIKTKS